MKKIILFLIMTSIFAQAQMASDKFAHLFVGGAIYVGCFFVKSIGESMKYDMDYLNTTTCLIPVIVAGAGKELYDSTKDDHDAEFADFAYTMALPLTAGIVLYKW